LIIPILKALKAIPCGIAFLFHVVKIRLQLVKKEKASG